MKVYKTKRFHETNYTERQNIVNNKTMNNLMIDSIKNTIALECEEERNT